MAFLRGTTPWLYDLSIESSLWLVRASRACVSALAACGSCVGGQEWVVRVVVGVCMAEIWGGGGAAGVFVGVVLMCARLGVLWQALAWVAVCG